MWAAGARRKPVEEGRVSSEPGSQPRIAQYRNRQNRVRDGSMWHREKRPPDMRRVVATKVLVRVGDRGRRRGRRCQLLRGGGGGSNGVGGDARTVMVPQRSRAISWPSGNWHARPKSPSCAPANRGMSQTRARALATQEQRMRGALGVTKGRDARARDTIDCG